MGLDCLPAEILVFILSMLDCVRDAACLLMASRALYDRTWLTDVVVRCCVLHPTSLLCAGAPLAIVRKAFDRWGVRPRIDMLAAAASGGRIANARWLFTSVFDPSSLSEALVLGDLKCPLLSQLSYSKSYQDAQIEGADLSLYPVPSPLPPPSTLFFFSFCVSSTFSFS